MCGAPEPALIVSLVEFSAADFAVTLLLILSYREVATRREKFASGVVEVRKESSGLTLSLRTVVNFLVSIVNHVERFLLWCWGACHLFPLIMLTLLTLKTASSRARNLHQSPIFQPNEGW